MSVAAREARLGRWSLVAGAAPFCAGLLVSVVGRDAVGSPIPCPVRAVAGVPCPLCGGTRAFELAATGDPGFLAYNGFWVLLAVAALVAGVGALLAARAGRAPLSAVAATLGRRPVAAIAVIALGGWIVALANRGAIVGS